MLAVLRLRHPELDCGGRTVSIQGLRTSSSEHLVFGFKEGLALPSEVGHL